MKFTKFLLKHRSADETLIACFNREEKYFILLTKCKDKYTIYHQNNYWEETKIATFFIEKYAYETYAKIVNMTNEHCELLKKFDLL